MNDKGCNEYLKGKKARLVENVTIYEYNHIL